MPNNFAYNKVSNIIVWRGIKSRLTWIPGGNVFSFFPFTQVYGIVFNKDNEVLVIKNENGNWQVPGGSPENNEAPEITLSRELLEEADVTIKNIKLIGAQEVDFFEQDNPNKEHGNHYYQLRYIADIDQVLPQTPDPDGGEIHPRKFIKFDSLADHIKWGNVGDALFKTAWDEHSKT